MSIVVLRLPDLKCSTETRSTDCPHCQAETFQPGALKFCYRARVEPPPSLYNSNSF